MYIYAHICSEMLIDTRRCCIILIMSKRITITIPEDIYEVLVKSSQESMRGLAVEAVYRIKLGLSNSSVTSVFGGQVTTPTYTTTSSNTLPTSEQVEKLAKFQEDFVSSGFSEEQLEIIEKLKSMYSDGYQPDSDEIAKLRQKIIKVGWTFNDKSRALWNLNGGKWKFIRQF